MNRKIKVYKILSLATVLLWMLVGGITIYSVINGSSLFIINSIIGFLFLLVGLFFFIKSRNTISFCKNIIHSDHIEAKSYHKFLNLEIVLVTIFFLIGMIFISGIIPRVFVEKFPVFG